MSFFLISGLTFWLLKHISLAVQMCKLYFWLPVCQIYYEKPLLLLMFENSDREVTFLLTLCVLNAACCWQLNLCVEICTQTRSIREAAAFDVCAPPSLVLSLFGASLFLPPSSFPVVSFDQSFQQAAFHFSTTHTLAKYANKTSSRSEFAHNCEREKRAPMLRGTRNWVLVAGAYFCLCMWMRAERCRWE